MTHRGSFLPVLLIAALVFGLRCHPALCGPLFPTPGIVVPTPGPEPRIPVNAQNTPGNVDFTFVIGQPGSYYLQGNIVGEVNKGGILISASGVTLDLNGFALMENPASVAIEAAGIIASAGVRAVTVKNGTVSGWSDAGITLSTVIGGTLESVSGFSNTLGIRVGRGFVVQGCTSTNSSNEGFHSLSDTSFINCSAVDNIDGFHVGANGVIEGCAASNNSSNGIEVGAGTVCVGNTVSQNGIHGIIAFDAPGGLIRDNVCRGNGLGTSIGAGIHVIGNDWRVEGNNCSGNRRGVSVQSVSNFITRNICSANSGANWNVVAGNVCLVVNAATTSALINGSSGGTAPGSTDPNANFSY